MWGPCYQSGGVKIWLFEQLYTALHIDVVCVNVLNIQNDYDI